MPSTEKFEEFCDFIQEPLDHLIDITKNDLNIFLKQLSDLFNNLVGEARRNFEEYRSKNENSSHFFKSLKFKIDRIEQDLFITINTNAIFQSTKLAIIRDGDPKVTYPYYIHSYITDIKKIFTEFSQANDNAIIPRPSILSVTDIRKNESQGFELNNDRVNFKAVHRILAIDNNFIHKSHTIEDIKGVFSGKTVTNKIIWFNANSLRYFIRNIIDIPNLIEDTDFKKRNVIHPKEGIWQRTIKCFQKSDGEYIVKNFQITHDPVASVTIKLDQAISYINNPSKKTYLFNLPS